MKNKFSANSPEAVTGEKSIEINKSINDVFSYIIDGIFFYMGNCSLDSRHAEWSVEMFTFDQLIEQQEKIKKACKNSVIEQQLMGFQPYFKLIFSGKSLPYKHSYLLEFNAKENITRLTVFFELLDYKASMNPFKKLINYSIGEGAKNIVEDIKNSIDAQLI